MRSIGLCLSAGLFSVDSLGREHVAEDDAANQKLHEMATKGQLRKNKRGHGMLDDDSSDDENKARGAKFKKRKVQGTDDLDEIGT